MVRSLGIYYMLCIWRMHCVLLPSFHFVCFIASFILIMSMVSQKNSHYIWNIFWGIWTWDIVTRSTGVFCKFYLMSVCLHFSQLCFRIWIKNMSSECKTINFSWLSFSEVNFKATFKIFRKFPTASILKWLSSASWEWSQVSVEPWEPCVIKVSCTFQFYDYHTTDRWAVSCSGSTLFYGFLECYCKILFSTSVGSVLYSIST